MREIAEAAGLGKSTLYDYFKTKDEILVYYFEDQINDLAEEAQKIAMQNKSADNRLRQITQMHMEFLQANKNLFMKLSLEIQRLKQESQNNIQEKRHAYQASFGLSLTKASARLASERTNPIASTALQQSHVLT